MLAEPAARAQGDERRFQFQLISLRRKQVMREGATRIVS
jgi:hypothetical protein